MGEVSSVQCRNVVEIRRGEFSLRGKRGGGIWALRLAGDQPSLLSASRGPTLNRLPFRVFRC